MTEFNKFENVPAPGREISRPSKVLVLYVGGTIGMCRNKDGVYVPAKDFIIPLLKSLHMFHDPSASDTLCTEDNMLVMKQLDSGRRVVYQVIEYCPLLDSSDMTFDNYARIALDIKTSYLLYDGFVVLHGTDTMAYTASALSFMLENLGKPIILTGSQIPICEVRSDGRDNFLGALILAGLYNIPEVAIAFNNVLLRGNRSTKTDSEALDAFQSPNLAPLAELGVNIHVQWDAIFMHSEIDCFNVHTSMCRHVTVLRIVPGMSLDTIRAVLQPPIAGVLLHTFGSGNAPSNPQLISIIREATERGIIIVNITQCMRGTVAANYATGKALLDAGVLPGSDMTVEAALMKLSYVLSKDDWSLEKKREMIGTNLRGEMKSISTEASADSVEFALIGKLAEALRLSSSEEKYVLQSAIFPPLACAAARRGDINQLRQLKAAGATFIQSDYDKRTALHIAAAEGHIEVVKYLVTNGASVHARDRYDHVPLDDAIRFGHHDIIRILVQAGAHLTLSPTDIGVQLCSVVVQEGVNGLESWRLAGANLGQGDYCGRTAMHVAAATGNGEVVEYLIQHGVRTRVADSLGITPMSEARRRGRTTIVSMFERRGSVTALADLNGTDKFLHKT